jgi:hypothetical protein
MNRALEFHDSTLASIEKRGEDVVLSFVPAYVHESNGVPGVDRGMGYTQDVEFWIRSGSITTAVPEMPIDLADGTLAFGGSDDWDPISVPLELHGPVRLELTTFQGQLLSVEGAGAKTEAIGPSTFVELFPGVDAP